MKKPILLAMMLFIANIAFAGRGAYLIIENNTPNALHIEKNDWQCLTDTTLSHTIPSASATKYYLEAINDISCWYRASQGRLKIFDKNHQEIAITKFSLSNTTTKHILESTTSDDYKIKAAAYNTIDRASGQDLIFVQINPNANKLDPNSNDYQNWMRNLGEKIAYKKLSQVVLPGTHDSFTFDLNGAVTCQADPDASAAAKIPYFGKKFAQAQDQNFITQLNRGIRYFDVRLCHQHGKDYTTHSLISNNTFQKELSGLANFLNQHPKEIVILDFNHMYGYDKAALSKLLNYIESYYSQYLLSYQNYNPQSLINNIWQSKRNLIIVMPDTQKDIAKKINPAISAYLWPESTLSSPWPNTTNIDTDLAKNTESLHNRDQNQLFVSQLQLTPNGNYILHNPSYNLYFNAYRYAPETHSWININTRKGLNIFITDFSSGYDSTLLAIKANQ
ncbi:phosphatidylinositol-specific phospholipase C domain-containing protein [Facilibium subflavum]|uniref:phosphatidylinositol-specific phospholipase C domain-containing protein n=1 Tax=Facilibium subflavum TaxID=2219058 RepID=UPI000E657541|nr:phosphatidylinositol-specific phospholipase C domain-containing protein [Facilibium subflavum]